MRSERLAEEERRAAEEEAARAAAEQKKREEEERLTAQYKQCEEERQQAQETARHQQQREEEALQRQVERKAAQASGPEHSCFPPREEPTVWRRSGVSSSRSGVDTLPRVESPAPAVGKYRSGALSGGSGGWRAREAAKQQISAAGDAILIRSASPAPVSPAPVHDDPPRTATAFRLSRRICGGVCASRLTRPV